MAATSAAPWLLVDTSDRWSIVPDSVLWNLFTSMESWMAFGRLLVNRKPVAMVAVFDSGVRETFKVAFADDMHRNHEPTFDHPLRPETRRS